MAAKSMEELLSKSGYNIQAFRRGEKISAKVTEITPKSVLFDIGGKTEGILSDIYLDESRDYVKTLKVGDQVTATVINPESPEGRVILSLRSAASESIWERLNELMNQDKTVTVAVAGVAGRGLSVEFEGIQGFIPASHLGKSVPENLETTVGGKLKVKISEVDKARKRIVFSEKYVSEAQDLKEVADAVGLLKEGEVYEGIVVDLTNFGAFVEVQVSHGKKLTPVEGLVHVSEISWEKVADPSTVLKVGEKTKVSYIGTRDGKIAFSIRRALEDPWITISQKYKKDDKFKGKVTRKSDFGVFVQLEPGVEGLIHITKIAPGTQIEVGKEINCYIEEVDAPSRKISLGMVLTAKPVGYR